MPQTIDIPEVGRVEFPDSMSEGDITSAIQNRILPDFKAHQLAKASLLSEQAKLLQEPEPSTGKLFLEEASQPFVPIPRPDISPNDSELMKFGKGLSRSGIGLLEGIESPLGVATMAASALPVVGPYIARAAAVGFGLNNVASGAQKAAEAYQTGNIAEAGEAAGDVIGGSVIARGGFAKPRVAARKAPKADALDPSTVLPESANALKQIEADKTSEIIGESTPPTGSEPSVKEFESQGKQSEPTPQDSTPADPAPLPVSAVPAEQTRPTKWTAATADPSSNLGAELYSGIPNPVAVAESVIKMAKDVAPYLRRASEAALDTAKEIGAEVLSPDKMTDYRRAVLNWSAKLQRSFVEAAAAQKEIETKVPDPVKREGITNWIQADGDRSVLQDRAQSTTDPKLKKGYEAALTLSPEEIAVANDVRSAYQALGARAKLFDVLKNFKDNYVTQIWDLGKGPAMGSSRTLKENFRFSRASTFPTFFDGEQSRYVPKTKDIAKLLPVYLHEMNSVIAARQLVQEMGKGVASDGRPLIAPRGTGVPVENPQGTATLIIPKAVKGDTLDYQTLRNQPALNEWKWAAKDEAGNPIFLKSDLAIHPEAATRLSNVLGKSALKEWYESKNGALAAIPKALLKGLDMAQSETKRTMLGLLATFHQVQEGTHAIGHRVNPFFNIPKIDLVNDLSQMDAAQHGLMLAPDRASANQFMEGFRTSGLISKLPILGELSDFYSNFLFHEYIPGLKFKTYEAIRERNKSVYEKDLANGDVTMDDVKALSAQQANAAYGHLNYTDMARNPTIQHIMQLGLLAPDFLEARARFAGQAITGLAGKVGREQVLALATLALTQATAAWTAAHLAGGEWDPQKPFEFHVGNRSYTMRSVPEDIASLLKNTRQFVYSRVNPIIGRGTVQYLSGVNWRGEKVTPTETTMELAQQPLPISLRGFLGTSPSSLSGWEQLAGTLGLRISRYNPFTDVRQMISTFKKNSDDPKVVAEANRAEKETYVSSDYSKLRNALADNDTQLAIKEYANLLATKTDKAINSALNPKKPLTGSKAMENAFVASLTPEQRKRYDAVIEQREQIYDRFKALPEPEHHP